MCVNVLNMSISLSLCVSLPQPRPPLSVSLSLPISELRDFEPDDQLVIEVDEGNTAVIECHLPESQPKAQVRYSVKQEWLETSKG